MARPDEALICPLAKIAVLGSVLISFLNRQVRQ